MAFAKNDNWHMDLMDVKNISKYNDGYTFVLVVCDVLSKMIYTYPLKTKHGASVAQGLAAIIKQADDAPWSTYSDNGTEFKNATVKKLLAEHNVEMRFSRNPDTKAAIAEQAIGLIRARLQRYFTENNTFRFVEALPLIVDGLNRRYVDKMKMRPVDVTVDNQDEVYRNVYGSANIWRKNRRCRKSDDEKTRLSTLRRRIPQFKVGDKVRISREKRTFEKGYEPNFSTEIFTIAGVTRRTPRAVYKLKDYAGELLEGRWYGTELVRTAEDKTKSYHVDVLKRRGNEVFVKWHGYPASYNQWIPAHDIEDL